MCFKEMLFYIFERTPTDDIVTGLYNSQILSVVVCQACIIRHPKLAFNIVNNVSPQALMQKNFK